MTASDFWDFSTSVYRRKDVADTCLALQDRYGLDVNLLLYCCWRGKILTGEEMAAAIALATPWRDEVVRPLRHLRRALKPGFPPMPEEDVQALRERIAAAELDAEKLQQQALDAASGRKSAPKPEAAEANLKTYLALERISADARLEALLAVLRAGAFPETESAPLAISAS